ncbi:hypothetical protein MRU69_01200 [Kocuria flava]|uniref:hypothetical protein n=1 Tax=Kocuria flava TaxID=446860 RepID=UPI001FF1FCBC|nr:hypothetical protein [Kocuria flava]MCJ8503483.1 hypothetical protein [Kocuria flava]
MFLSATVLLLLLAVGVALSSDNGSPSAAIDDAASSTGMSTEEGPHPASILFSLPAQLVAMAFFGRLTVSMGSPLMGTQSGNEVFSVLFSPLLLAAIGALVLHLLARRLVGRIGPLGAASTGVLALAGGLALAAVVVLLATISTVRYSDDESSFPVSLSLEAASGTAFVLAWLTGTLVLMAALLPRGQQRPGARLVELGDRYLPSLSRALPVLAVHLTVFLVPAALLLVVVAFTERGWAGGLSTPLWVPSAVLWLFTWAHLSGVSVQTEGAARQLLAWADAPSGGTAYLWGVQMPGWVVALLLLLAVVSVVAASVAWRVRRDAGPDTLGRPASWAALPLLYFLLGLLLTAVARVAAGMDASLFGLGTVSAAALLRPAAWTCLVLLVVGGIVETLSRYAAPALLAVLPAGLVRRLQPSAPAASASGPAPDMGPGRSPDGTSAGSPAASPGGAQQHAGPSRPPMSEATRKKVRTALVAGLAVAVLAVATAVAHSVLSRTVFSPSHEVESYLQSVVDGQALDAAQALDPNVPTDQRLLLNDDVYGAAANPVTGYSIQDVTVNGSTAEVSAEITQDSVTTPVQFTLAQDGRRAGLFKDWALQDGGSALYRTLSVDVPAGVTELTVNGTALDLAEAGIPDGENVSLVALPGDYVITPPPGGKYMSYGAEQTVEVRADGSGDTTAVSFTAEPTDAVRDDAIAAANAAIDACAAKAEFDPEDCPFGSSFYDDDDDYRNPVWTVESYPTYAVEDTWGSVYLSTEDPGEVTLTYEYNTEWDDEEPADWESQDTTETVYFSAPIVLDGDRLSLDLSGTW